jgi:hypothetical protein
MEKVFGTEKPVFAVGWAAVLFLMSYLAFKAIYNLFFHPLSKFPGPKIAAVGSYYEFYHDVCKDGTYLWKIEEMHRKYGNSSKLGSWSIYWHS